MVLGLESYFQGLAQGSVRAMHLWLRVSGFGSLKFRVSRTVLSFEDPAI